VIYSLKDLMDFEPYIILEKVDVLTFEIELVNLAAFSKIRRLKVYPSPQTLNLIQNSSERRHTTSIPTVKRRNEKRVQRQLLTTFLSRRSG
jgi:phosphoribosylaminoimidazole carboxylase (NCAIR synthetase)